MNLFLKNKINKFLIGTLLLAVFFLSVPQKSYAQLAVVEVNSTPNLLQQVINTGNSVITSASAYSLQIKEYVLDSLALVLAKQIIRQITTSLVTWINSGFEGSPSFLQNPGAFFLDVADQVTGDFLAKAGGPLVDLCSPFSIDIRLALAFRYRPNVPQRYACTLSTIIKNSKSAVEGASINGFTAGDFKQGGWPAFVSLTTEPQNNIYGAYLTAESELSIRVANAEIGQREEISAGRGFLSWRDPKCSAEVKAHNAQVEKQYKEQVEVAQATDYSATVSAINSGGEARAQLRSKSECPVETPGSVIESQLQHSLGGPLRELELADEINEVVNALFAQLVLQVMQKGLGGVSGSGAGDGSSYISSIQNEAAVANNTDRVDEIRSSLLSNMDVYLQNTTQYKTSKDASLNAILDAKRSYESVKSCYAGKIAGSNPNLNESQANTAQARINTIDSLIISKVAPIAATQLTAVQEADSRLKTLNDIKTTAIAAKTVNDINKPSQQYALLVQEQRLTNSKDVVEAQQEYDSVSKQAQEMKTEAGRMYQECEAFPQVIRNR